MKNDDDNRWRDWDEDGDELRDWEIEPEEEKEDSHSVLDGTAPVAKFVFLAIVLAFVIGGLAALARALARM
jgi:hypothetical protein